MGTPATKRRAVGWSCGWCGLVSMGYASYEEAERALAKHRDSLCGEGASGTMPWP